MTLVCTARAAARKYVRLIAVLAILPALSACVDGAAPSGQCLSDDIAAYQAYPAALRAEAEAATAAVPYAEGRLWQATRGDVTITVMGTMHVPMPRHLVAPITRALKPVIDQADVMLLEVTREEMAALESRMAQDPALVLLPGNQRLSALLSEAEWQQLQELMSVRGVPGVALDRIQPWVASAALSSPPCISRQEARGVPTLDDELEALAVAARVGRGSLDDNPDALLRAFIGDRLEDQVDQLRLQLRFAEQGDRQFAVGSALYFDGRTWLSWELAIAEARLSSGGSSRALQAELDLFQNLLLRDRNRAWMGKIMAEATRSDDIVIIVGALHLPGQDGVLLGLERAGFSLNRLPL